MLKSEAPSWAASGGFLILGDPKRTQLILMRVCMCACVHVPGEGGMCICADTRMCLHLCLGILMWMQTYA